MKKTSIEELYEVFLKHPQISKDTRQVDQGSIYFALKGESFDGNRFAEDAILKGAAFAVIDDPNYKKDEQFLLVDNCLKTLQKLANYHRQQLNIPVIGISGSNGKTTTKELIAATLNKKYKILYTEGNYNNHIGVPLTLLRISPEHEIAVIEMGANHQGEIDMLCNIAEPNYGMLSNIGKAHLEGFGGVEGVKKGKTELFRFLQKNNSPIFINLDDSAIRESAPENNIITYSLHDKADCRGKVEQTHPNLKGIWKTKNASGLINSSLYGEYNFHNILAAICIANFFEVEAKKIDAAISEYQSDMNRSQILKKDGLTIFLDAYNANPTSMSLSIENFDKVESKNKIAIIGDMFELGDAAHEEHKKIIQQSKEMRSIHLFIFVGVLFHEHYHESKNAQFFSTTDEAKKWFKSQELKGSTVLLKGSRGMRLEALLS
ncbi:MAG: UDP-N-acetylmuramoyl-tripeptide--D-alanyl-D-alanine ligase [Flavobacteriales bacterium]|nr:UDP-N-acetylmuramoyl-tripeptide--D-alanyl-D-alanine ligase [Flavobacteriales bacterium]